MKQAFILSDCELPECDEKTYALLVANPTKGHHFIAQTEQRQFAFNTQVNPQNQNVYRWPLSRFYKPYKSEILSVNIENNLEVNNLYTLAFLEGYGGKQYNLESWFNRYESGYEDACAALRLLEPHTQPANKQLMQILKLKLLGILRNPYNKKNVLVHHFYKSLAQYLPQSNPAFSHLIAARPAERVQRIISSFQFTLPEYTQWLSNLYAMLSEGIHQPSLFDQLFSALFADSNAVNIELYRYSDAGRYCYFSDSGYCLQASNQSLSIGFGIAADLFAIVHVSRYHWENLAAYLTISLPTLKNTVSIHDNQHIQRITYNRLCIRQAHEAVYGKSNLNEAFL